MSYKNKTYVALDYDEDSKFYNRMLDWKENENIDFVFYNAHDSNNLLDDSSEETIKAKLRERMNSSKNFILLVGEKTQYKNMFVRWEIEEALKRQVPIIVVNLNGERKFDDDYCPAILDEELAIHTDFCMKIIKFSLDEWPERFEQHLENETKPEPRWWSESVYEDLDL